MLTLQDFDNLFSKKMHNNIVKTIVRKSYPPEQADIICRKIDNEEYAEYINKTFREMNELCLNYWNQQSQALMNQFQNK